MFARTSTAVRLVQMLSGRDAAQIDRNRQQLVAETHQQLQAHRQVSGVAPL